MAKQIIKDEAEAMKHCGFAAPAYGVARAVPIGETYVDAWGNVHIETKHGDKIIRKA